MNHQTTRSSASPFSSHEFADHAQGAVLAPVLDPHGRIPDAIDARLADLARRAQGGELAARDALFLALWPRCSRMLGAICRQDRWRSHSERAWTFEDVDQEAFPIFCDLVDRWRSDQPRFAGYFFSRFRWRITDVLWRWSRPARIELAFPANFDAPIGDDEVTKLRLLIDSLFASLSARDRQLLVWRIIEDRTDAEIAAACGICLKTARRWRTGAFARARSIVIMHREALRS